eukprot:4025258-Amphidinium_carterae.1
MGTDSQLAIKVLHSDCLQQPVRSTGTPTKSLQSACLCKVHAWSCLAVHAAWGILKPSEKTAHHQVIITMIVLSSIVVSVGVQGDLGDNENVCPKKSKCGTFQALLHAAFTRTLHVTPIQTVANSRRILFLECKLGSACRVQGRCSDYRFDLFPDHATRIAPTIS